MATRSIKLVRDAQEIVTLPGRGDVFTMKIVTVDAVLMPLEIFGHQNTLYNPKLDSYGPEFMFVCSPFDLTIYPVGAPDLLMEKQFYRRDIIDVLVPSQTMADEVWQDVNREVEALVVALNRLDILLAREVVRIGDEGDDETSTSESESESESESFNGSISD